MKSVILILFISTISFTLFANRDDDARAVVKKWNELHNSHNLQQFSELYAREVLFYAKDYTNEKCVAVKKKLFAAGFQQEIITPITVEHYSSGTIKCNFTKRTTVKKNIQEHACYMLIRKIDGDYKVVGEGDLMSDARRGFELNLGAETMNPSKKNTILVVSLSFVLATAIGWWLARRNKSEGTAVRGQEVDTPTAAIQTKEEDAKKLEAANLAVIAKVKAEIMADLNQQGPLKTLEEQKGLAFENFIVKKFDLKGFRLLEWRSDKYHEGRYAQTNTYPDMEWELVSPFAKRAVFAVECKYRSQYYRDGVKLCEAYQVKNYQQFAKERKIPVYLLLGVGGLPAVPDELFVIPLNKVKVYMDKYELAAFKKRKAEGTFFYNPTTKILS